MYMTPKQAAEVWDVSPRYVNYMLKNKAVPGALAAGRYFLIPVGLKKPSIRDKGKYPLETGKYEPIADTALRWGVTPRWILDMIANGILPDAVRIARNYYLPAGCPRPVPVAR